MQTRPYKLQIVPKDLLICTYERVKIIQFSQLEMEKKLIVNQIGEHRHQQFLKRSFRKFLEMKTMKFCFFILYQLLTYEVHIDNLNVMEFNFRGVNMPFDQRPYV